MKINLKKGMSIVELIVFIALIGLSGVVAEKIIAKSNKEASDVSIESNLVRVRSGIELIFLENGSYEGICEMTEKDFYLLIEDSVKEGGVSESCLVSPDGSSFAISVPYRSDRGKSFCIDSQNNSKEAQALIFQGVAMCVK